MKKADFRLPSPAGFTAPTNKSGLNQKETHMNHFSRASIVTPTAVYVQTCKAENQPPKKQVRIKRGEITPEALSTEMRALGRHIARCSKKGRPVRIPALRGSELGQVLRTLELKRAFN
jgi:hypothetical protein